VETLEGHLEESFVVTEEMGIWTELLTMNVKKIAEATDGKNLSDVKDLVNETKIHAERSQEYFVEEKRLLLWETPYWLALILVFLGIEWYLRRRGGMI
jgi:hypothetical protein